MASTGNVVAAVLAGGRGRRLGEPKMLAEIGGDPLLLRPLRAAREAGLEAVVVAKAGSALPPLSCRILVEDETPEHPLLGIVTALRELRPAAIVALGGDLPFVPVALLRALADAPRSTVCVAAGRPQPLVARYDLADLPILEKELGDDASLTTTVRAIGADRIDGLRLAALDPAGHAFFNVNTPDDLRRARVLAEPRAERNAG